MPEYTIVASEETRYGSNEKKFIEISRKKVVNDEGEESEFINIAKGHYNRAGKKETGTCFKGNQSLVNFFKFTRCLLP